LNFEVVPTNFKKKIKVPTSKSYANRLLILAAVSKETIKIVGLPKSTDVKFMLDCLIKIGLKIQFQEDSVTIENSFPECEDGNDDIDLDTGDGGTTNRFLVALLARGKKNYKLHTRGHMENRPMGELLRVLSDNGVITKFPAEDYWIGIQGPFKTSKKVIEVDSSETTQFATGLALAFHDLDLKIEMIAAESSQKYFEITKNLIENFKSKKEFQVPVDFSSLSYPLAAALTRGEVVVENCLERDFDQADSALIDIIPEIGGKLKWSESGLSVFSDGAYNGINRDCADYPDLVPTLVYMAAYADGESQLKNIKTLRHKESDRILQSLQLLKLFEVEHSYHEEKDVLTIQGRKPLTKYKEFIAPDDHRIVMVAYLFMKANGGGKIINSQHVSKSFPDFFQVME